MSGAKPTDTSREGALPDSSLEAKIRELQRRFKNVQARGKLKKDDAERDAQDTKMWGKEPHSTAVDRFWM